MTTRDVYDRHMRHERDGDLDAIVSDYAPDAIVATPDGIGSGRDYIRQSYERVLPLISSLELASSIQVLGDVLYLTFRANRNGTDELIGTDTFVIHDDLIYMHTFYATSPSPTIDEQPRATGVRRQLAVERDGEVAVGSAGIQKPSR
jgi:hypothetical protein